VQRQGLRARSWRGCEEEQGGEQGGGETATHGRSQRAEWRASQLLKT
jgi:hypothetical protein